MAIQIQCYNTKTGYIFFSLKAEIHKFSLHYSESLVNLPSVFQSLIKLPRTFLVEQRGSVEVMSNIAVI